MDDEDGKHLVETLRVLNEAGEWAKRTNADAPRLPPPPRSSLCGDDDRAHPYELSHAVWHSLSNAVDHLCCLRALLGDAKAVHMYAPFTLARAALENACGAVWLLHPPQRKVRVARRLRLAIADVRNGEQARQLTGLTGPRTERERLDQIGDIASRAGLDEAAVKSKATYTEIVKAVDSIGPGNTMIEVCWKVCSGYSHGDLWTTLGASRRTEIRSTDREGIGTFRIEASLRLLKEVTAVAVIVTRWGWQLHDQRSTPPS